VSVSALELKPRGAVALFDAALHLCASHGGLWALTFPGGAAVVCALYLVADAVHLHHGLVGPVAALTAAWLVRALGQGAAAHLLSEELVGREAPSLRACVGAALRRAPGLVTAAAVMGALNLLIWAFTAGLGFLFFSAHLCGYPVTMRGEGNVLRLPSTCNRLLGPARATAGSVRLLGASQLLLAVNLHTSLLLTLHLGPTILGLDVAWLNRFCSLSNPVWLACLAGLTFAVFEPIRAACATLLLIDGRVRQEGLDLLAQVEQLPKLGKSGARLATLLVAALLLPAPAHASALRERLQKVLVRCEVEPEDAPDLSTVDALPAAAQAPLSRFVRRVEDLATEEQDCEGAVVELEAGVEELARVAHAPATRSAADARAEAARVLARPEFQEPATPDDAQPTERVDESDWLQRLLEWLARLLKDTTVAERERPLAGPSMPMFGASVVIALALALVVGVLVYLLVHFRRRPEAAEQEALDQGLVSQAVLDEASALSRPAEGWAELADRLADQRRYRDAIRALYLSLLARLHRDGAIDYEPTASNWDSVRSYRGPREGKQRFRTLTERFDFAWYGQEQVAQEAWATFRETTLPLLSAPAPELAP
jgi:hypothetical protein